MAKNTFILLGDYFDNFINKQIKTGKFSSPGEVVRAALRMFEYEERKKAELITELEKGGKIIVVTVMVFDVVCRFFI
jgi:antitoxin ParD1/3/4